MCLGLFMNLTTMNNIKESKIESFQPSPLILDNDSNFIIQPIVENIDISGYELIMAFKLYYKDKTPKAIIFKKGEPLETYCSDSTIVTFYIPTKQPVVIGSVKRMSCKILAIFNLDKSQNNILRDYPLDSIQIQNYVTNNKYTFRVEDKTYFNRWITKYNNWR
jgi:hypothetical protein